MKNVVCKCCKEVGHRTDKCLNDPNYHTTFGSLHNLELQQKRINKIHSKKRFYADTLVQTTHFLKKCAIIPPQRPQNDDEEGETKNYQMSKSQIYKHPFKRGALSFEDYNYDLHNPYVMIQNDEKCPETPVQERLTEFRLEQLCTDEYKHELDINVKKEPEVV